MRGRGWSEAEVAERILPYMPPAGRGEAGGAGGDAPPGRGRGRGRGLTVPVRVSTAWLDRHLPTMDREGIRLVVEELEQRGWTATALAIAVLPHLLPKLPAADATAILEGLRELGLREKEIARLRPAGD